MAVWRGWLADLGGSLALMSAASRRSGRSMVAQDCFIIREARPPRARPRGSNTRSAPKLSRAPKPFVFFYAFRNPHFVTRQSAQKLRANTSDASNDGGNDDDSRGDRRSNDGGSNRSDDGGNDGDSRTKPPLEPRSRLRVRR